MGRERWAPPRPEAPKYVSPAHFPEDRCVPRPGWAIVRAWVITDDICVPIVTHCNVIAEAHSALGDVVDMRVGDFYSYARERGWKIRKSSVE